VRFLPGQPANSRRVETVDRAFRSLPERFLGAPSNFDATYRVRLADVGHTWEIRITPEVARVHKGTTRRHPDVTIATDAATWMRLRAGDISSVDAFRRKLLTVRGNLDQAIALEGMFRLPNGRAPKVHIDDVRVGRHTISTLTMGDGHPVLLIHGLGGTRASMFETASALSRRYRVHAVDLPGFGSSSKPARGHYNARWFAEILTGLLDELQIPAAHLVGNSMGGRIAIEMGMRSPQRVTSLGLLCPAVAWIRRDFHPIVRLLRPEFGMLPHQFTRSMVAKQFWGIFYDRDAIDPAVGEVIVDEFRRIYHTAAARYAFLSSARNIYLDRPFGRNGFYPRLADLEPPALFIWGSHDPLVPPSFARYVEKWLPSAQQVTLEQTGHLPQVERPEQTNELLGAFFTWAERTHRRDRLLRAA
jgi:pimeloyl-ACP methyl ester carboxylesterase